MISGDVQLRRDVVRGNAADDQVVARKAADVSAIGSLGDEDTATCQSASAVIVSAPAPSWGFTGVTAARSAPICAGDPDRKLSALTTKKTARGRSCVAANPRFELKTRGRRYRQVGPGKSVDKMLKIRRKRHICDVLSP